MTFPQTGGCLCGGVRYEITRSPMATYTCHCTRCQRLTTSAFSLAIVMVAEACHFTITAEPRPFHRVTEGGRTAMRWTCAECGVWICGGAKPGTAPPGSFVVLRAGTLDDTSWLRPTVHFWTRSAQPWIVLPEGDTQFETQPEDYLAWLRSAQDHQRRSDP